MKRRSSLVLVLLLVVNGLVLPVRAQADVQATVRPDFLHVRQSPGADAPILGDYARSTVLRVMGREDGGSDGIVWVYTTPLEGGLTGWVHSGYLIFPDGFDVRALPVVGETGAAPAADAPAAAPAAGGLLSAVTAQAANFRTGPELTYSIIRQLPPRTPASLTGRNANGLWVKAVVDGQEGWLYSKLLRVDGDPNSLPVVDGTPAEAAPGAAPAAAINPAVISGVGARARQIYLRGQQLGNRRNVFSKIGDSITESGSFLVPIGVGGVQLGDYGTLQRVVSFYTQATANTHNSFANTSLAARSGWSSGDLLNPERVYSPQCQPGESPLVCEYRVVRPAVALIMIGTNDITFGVDSGTYRANLERIVQTSIDMGVIPVLSTIPDNQRDPSLEPRVLELNGIIASVAGAYGVPLWNYWQALQGLPGQGLSGDGYHPSVDPATGESAVFTAQGLQYGYTVRNLTALMALDAVLRGALY